MGGANETHFPILSDKALEGASVAHIGTRVLEVSSGKAVMSFAKPASSVSELVATLIKENGFEMDADTATNLLMGIEEGSNHFEGSDVTPETFEVFAQLLRSGGQRLPKAIPVRSFPPGSIPGQPIQRPVSPVIDQPVQEQEQMINPPEDWLAQPKVYKGTSVS